MLKLIQIAGKIAVKSVSKLWNTIRSPWGNGAITGGLTVAGASKVANVTNEAIDKGKGVINSFIVLGLVGIVSYLIIRK